MSRECVTAIDNSAMDEGRQTDRQNQMCKSNQKLGKDKSMRRLKWGGEET